MAVKASRTRENGDVDPNAEAKDAAEARLYRLLKSRLGGQLDEVMALLGDPPDLSRLDQAFWESKTGELLVDLRPQLERMAEEAIAREALTVPIVWDELVIAREAADWAQAYTYDLVHGLTEHTRDWLRSRVETFIQTPGYTVGQMRADLAPAFGERRAQMIATTEVTRAYAQGTGMVQGALEKAGIHMERIWNTSRDERVCDLCGPLDGLPEREWGGVGPPPRHPNCRCWVTLRHAR